MSGIFFPVQLMHIFNELSQASEVMKGSSPFLRLARGAVDLPVKSPDDRLVRLILCSPGVQRAVEKMVKVRRFRIRIAVPLSFDMVGLSSLAQFEVYDGDGEPLQAPILLTELDDSLANAVQVELFHELLRAKGSSIPLL